MDPRLPKAPRRPSHWRLNGPRHEWLPTDAAPAPRRALPRPIGEIRRKADDRRIAWFGMRDGARGGIWRVQALPRARAATRAALRELQDLLRRLGPRGNLRTAFAAPRGCLAARVAGSSASAARVRRTRSGRVPRLAPLPIPADYAARTGLPRQPEPGLLIDAGRDAFGRRAWLQVAAARAWQRLRDAATRDQVTLQLVSAFRHTAYQTRLVQRKMARGLSLEEILTVNAAPGYSEHHSGRAIDLTTPGCAPAEVEFEATPAYHWLQRNAARYGFRLSYPRGNPHGVSYEPWHWYHAGDGADEGMP